MCLRESLLEQEFKSLRGSDRGVEVYKIAKDFLESKKRSPEDEIENRVIGFEGGGFLGRKKVPHLASSPSMSDGRTDSSGTTPPSPTKITLSPQHTQKGLFRSRAQPVKTQPSE